MCDTRYYYNLIVWHPRTKIRPQEEARIRDSHASQSRMRKKMDHSSARDSRTAASSITARAIASSATRSS